MLTPYLIRSYPFSLALDDFDSHADSRYPTSLVYLTLLQQALFRDRLRDPIFVNELVRIGVRHHETW
jgi:hypothetical protein